MSRGFARPAGRRHARRTAALTLSAAALFVTAACGGSGGGASAVKNPDGVLTIGINRAADDLDPFAFKGIFNVQSMVFEPLVASGENGKILPALAKSWEISADGKTYTFHLRPGVTFSDGSPWTAEAAKKSLHMWIGDPNLKDFLVTSALVTDITATNDLTLTLKLSKPYAYVLRDLSLVRPVRFLSPKVFTADGKYGGKPIGTGPWVVKSNGPTETVLTRNKDYWGHAPEFAEVDLKVIPDAKTRLTALRSGDIDLIGGAWTGSMLPEDAQELKNRPGGGVKLSAAPGTTTQILGFNPDRKRLTSDPAVRKAISLAIDRKAIAQSRYFGFADPAGSLMPGTVPTGEGKPAPAADLEAARQVLQKAGWTGQGTRSKNGVPLKLDILVAEENQPGVRQLAEVIQATLKKIGVNVQINATDHATSHDAVPAGEYDMTIFYTIGAPYDPLGTLTNSFLSTLASSDGKIWTDPARLDPLIEKAVTARTEKERDTAITAIYRLLDDTSAFVPLVYPQRLWASGPRAHDVKLAPTDYDFPLDGIWMSGD
ncbi:ABC transporter substrate-binding protein [Streptomyces canus]|uniref:ABC transporter substrate-binding protein n=1 Tax=Streptomyces canus TaxID=58343 RepID=UPI000361FE6C|nr:ABC transporter substrate-binding protein [Streptomyces canus]